MAGTLAELMVNIVMVPLILVNSAIITVYSGLIINLVIGPVVLVCRMFDLCFRRVVRLQSNVLGVWFAIFMGHIEHIGGFTVRVTGDSFLPDESALVLCNHRTWIDSVMLFALARQVGRNGDCKFMAKKSLLLFPVFGLVGAVTDSVLFIQREAKRAGSAMATICRRLVDPRRRDLPFWMIIFPEGTRRTSRKLAEARDFAKKRDLRALDHVLQPRTKGFISMARQLRDTADAVYDVTIAYGGSHKPGEEDVIVPSFLRLYFTAALEPRVIHVHQRRIPMERVPRDEEAAKKWLYKLYEQKDALLESYYKNGKFEGEPMRWNKITIAHWAKCWLICSSAAAAYTAVAYALYMYIIVV